MTNTIQSFSPQESSISLNGNGAGKGTRDRHPEGEARVVVQEWEPEAVETSAPGETVPREEEIPAEKPKKRGKSGGSWVKKTLLVLPLLGAIAAFGGVGVMRVRNAQAPVQEAQQTAQPVGLPVAAVPVEVSPIQEWVFADGSATAVRSKHLTFEEGGTITYIKEVNGRDLREGDRVSEGELLAKVDDRRLNADLTQARATTAEAEKQKSVAIANLSQVRANRAQAQASVEQNYASIEQAKAKVEQARANRAQIEAKVEQAQVGVEQAEVKIEQAQANVAQARAKREQAISQVAQAKANLEKAIADLELARKEQQRRVTLYQEGAISQSDLDLYTNKLQNAEAAVATARSQVSAAESEVRAADSQLLAAEKEVDAAKRQAIATQKDVQAAQSQLAAATQDIEVAKSQVKAANSQLSAAESQVRAVEGNLRAAEAQVEAAQAGIESARSGITRASVNLEDSALYAPFDGIIAYLNITEGDYWMPQRVQPSADYQTIVEQVPMIVIDPSEFEVTVELPAFEGERVQPGQRAFVVLEGDASAAAGGDTTSDSLIQRAKARGRVFSVSPSVTPGGRSVEVKIRITDGTENLRHGGRVSAWIAVAENENATVAPLNAFVFRDRNPYVFVVNEATGKVEKREITPGIEGISQREIVAGVKPGELVVTEGKNRLVDGAPVQLIERVQ
ncbi:efflux RND transporter periplasmic adaptor subunit [Phormidium sp. CCY1219]|uniref:efflux RND transporter periplasmic adaptor subunit n=1 Tax=Phormidium sp. CCY1219 TaxID=2886104 RepID=UPI002D1F261D|nr:efflux RND transporter periplasmic adaptor subunit [Phormidium sp. CCY1219]MEB3826313.1 efflux RND transporter periplasmic adaptor subunit [Phormidium sp. CCY1219]